MVFSCDSAAAAEAAIPVSASLTLGGDPPEPGTAEEASLKEDFRTAYAAELAKQDGMAGVSAADIINVRFEPGSIVVKFDILMPIANFDTFSASAQKVAAAANAGDMPPVGGIAVEGAQYSEPHGIPDACTGGEKLNAAGTGCETIFCEAEMYVSNNQCIHCPYGTQRPAGDPADQADTVCSKKMCTCSNGVPVPSGRCHIHGAQSCLSCNEGYKKDSSSGACVEKEADGTANIAFFGLVILAFSIVGIVVAMKLTSNAPADGVKRAQEKDSMDVEDGAAGQEDSEEQEQMDNPLAANTATDQGLDGDAT
jgi:hypothetical protein